MNDSSFNVLGCDIAKDSIDMGDVRKKSFGDVWNSYEVYEVRNVLFPPGYRIKNDDGESLQDNLRPEYMGILSVTMCFGHKMAQIWHKVANIENRGSAIVGFPFL